MGSTSDMAHCEKIKKACGSYGIPSILRVTSAHKGPDETLRIKAEYEGAYSFVTTADFPLLVFKEKKKAGTSLCHIYLSFRPQVMVYPQFLWR